MQEAPDYLCPPLMVKLEDPKLKPLRVHPTDAGADLFSAEKVSLYPGEQKMLDTGVAIKIPVGFVGLVFNRSSQGKLGIRIPHSVGVIDSDYRGNIKVLLKNDGEEPYFIERAATRIAQLVVVPIALPKFIEISNNEIWFDTERGVGGFGSTG